MLSLGVGTHMKYAIYCFWDVILEFQKVSLRCKIAFLFFWFFLLSTSFWMALLIKKDYNWQTLLFLEDRNKVINFSLYIHL